LIGDGCGQISSVGPVDTSDQHAITFITNSKLIPRLEKSPAGAVIVDKPIEGLAKPQLIVKNVNAALIDVLTIFAPPLKSAAPGIDKSAKIGENVLLGRDVSIGSGVVIDDGAQIGESTFIVSGCKIGQNSKIGANCRLDCNVVIYHNCSIGNNVVIQANSTIGSTGFGYAFIDGAHRLIPHNGGVIIEDFVEIGANTCVDRAKFGNTVIGAGTKIDNLVQIAHNVVIGKCCLITAQVGIAGSTKLGSGVVLGGQAGLADNIEIGDGTVIGAKSAVFQNAGPGEQLVGVPALDRRETLRIITLTRRLPEMVSELKELAARMEKLEASKNDKV
jgi:UDP-3-O-[3-hydroxymyristoyl] glucosamine N-acyltransferase